MSKSFNKEHDDFLEIDDNTFVSYSRHWKSIEVRGSHLFNIQKEAFNLPITGNLEASFFNITQSFQTPFQALVYYNFQKKELKIARNQFGTVPLFYIHRPTEFFAFSTDLNFLLNLKIEGVNRQINYLEIYKYLSGTGGGLYDSNTVYEEVNSLSPGHFLIAKNECLDSKYFVEYNPNKWSDLKSPRDFGIEFKSLFLKSIANQTAHCRTIGSHLSGGLDSSSVSASIKHLFPDKTLHTYFSFTDTSLTDEGHYAIEVAKKIGSIHHKVPPGIDDLENLVFFTQTHLQPERSPIGTSLHASILREAGSHGCEILLTGHDGDGVVGHGREEYIHILFMAKEWKELRVQFNNLVSSDRTRNFFDEEWSSYNIDRKQRKIYELYFTNKTLKALKVRKYKSAFELVKSAYYEFNIYPTSLVLSLFDKIIETLTNVYHGNPLGQLILPEVVSSANKTSTPGKVTLSGKKLEYFDNMIFKNNVLINEEYFAVSNHYNLEVAHPFFDPALYELCLAVPPKILFNNGQGRSPLRESMKHILPESVRTRTNKAVFNHYNIACILRLLDQSQDYFLPNSKIWNMVNQKQFNTLVKIFKNDPFGKGMGLRTIIGRVISLAVWCETCKRI